MPGLSTLAPRCPIVTVQTTATRLVATTADMPARAAWGIVVKALSTNTVVVWVGDSLIDGSSYGFPLSAGESVSFPTNDPSDVYGYCVSANQKVAIAYT